MKTKRNTKLTENNNYIVNETLKEKYKLETKTKLQNSKLKIM